MKKYIKYIAIILLAIIAFGNINNVHAANSVVQCKILSDACKKDKDCEVVCSGTFTELVINNNSTSDGVDKTYNWDIMHYKKKDQWQVQAYPAPNAEYCLRTDQKSFSYTIGQGSKSSLVNVPNGNTRKAIQNGECPKEGVVYLKTKTVAGGQGQRNSETSIERLCLAEDVQECYDKFGKDLHDGGVAAITSQNGESVQIELPEIEEVDDSCEGILDDETTEFIRKLLTFVRYGGVIIALLLSTLDLIKAVSSGSQEDLTKAMKRFGKRMIFAALLFFVALIVGILLDIFGITVAEGCSL